MPLGQLGLVWRKNEGHMPKFWGLEAERLVDEHLPESVWKMLLLHTSEQLRSSHDHLTAEAANCQVTLLESLVPSFFGDLWLRQVFLH